MTNPNIRRISGRFKRLFVGIAVVAPLLTLLYWTLFNYLPQGLRPLQPYQIAELSWHTAALAFLVSLLPLGVAMFGLLTLTRLFSLYEAAVYFSRETVRLFHQLGLTLILWVIATLLYTSLLSVVLTFNNPAGKRTLVATFEYGDLALLLMGGVVILVSWIMDEGRKLEEEQAHTI